LEKSQKTYERDIARLTKSGDMSHNGRWRDAEQAWRKEAIRGMLDRLDPRERKIIVSRLGLEGTHETGPAHTNMLIQ
jgi:DNA-directed RNA polymerase sigma subunit (sigma70/sigma32)